MVLVICLVSGVQGQLQRTNGFSLNQNAGPALMSNAINDIMIVDEDVWVATGRGLSLTTDGGETWTAFTHEDSLGKGGVSAMAERDGIVWVATAFDTMTDVGEMTAGGGLSYTTDHGDTWHWISQPVDSRYETEYAPTTTNVQNITYDIALTDSAVWIASFAGGLRKSTDWGATWDVVTVDGLPFDVVDHLTHRVFSVISVDGNIWVGSAGGIHKSTDGGRHWTSFNHQNQVRGISGNFVVALGHQSHPDKDIIWGATLAAIDSAEFYAVSKTQDGGLTWSTCLEREFAHNFAFDGSAVYAATDNGLFKSLDFGETWSVFPQIIDSETGEGVYTTEMYSVDVGQQSVLWVGGADGLARTSDNGITWKVFRAFRVPGEEGTPKTYAYPNPFSPVRHHQIGGDGYVRFQYQTTRSTTVTVRVYDFGMNLVATIVEEKARPVEGDYAEVWNGRNQVGDMVANGVYFYTITMQGEAPLWGKVMVVN